MEERKLNGPHVTLVAAVAHNNVIGLDGDMPWRSDPAMRDFSRADMRHFRKLTKHKPLIMGRKTADSIPDAFWPFKNRVSYVLTRQLIYQRGAESGRVFTVNSLDEALEFAQGRIPFVNKINYSTLCVIGGEAVYREAMPLADTLEITHIDRKYNGDTFFPRIDLRVWEEAARKDHKGFSFVRYERK